MANTFSVDRVRFLAVAAALAGVASFQACTVNNNNTDEQDGGESNGGKNAAGAGTKAAGADEGGATSNAGSSGTVGGAGDEGGAAQGGAAQGGATSSLGGAAEGGAAQGGAGTCDDTVGDPACEGVSEGCSQYCVAAVTNLKPAAAVDAITCLEADATEFCDAGYECLTAATAKGCAEDVATECTAAATACDPDETHPACDQLLSGLNDAARAEAIACTTDNCFSVYSCAESLFFVNP